MMKKYFSAVLLPLIIAGCGSSSSSTIYIGKGEYIDSAVLGVSYECGVEKGVTNSNGEFLYEIGKDCNFYFGNSIFKTVTGDKLKKSRTKVYEKDVRVARFLQILDNDGDATNGIEITKEVIEHIPESAYKYDDEGMNQLFTALNKDVANYNGRLVTKEEAKSHIDSESGGVESKNSPKFTISPSAPKHDDLITLDASDSQGDIESYSWKVNGLISSEKIFKTSLPKGDYSVVLTIKYKDGKTKSSTKSLYIAPPPTKWAGVSSIESDSNSKLYIRTDKSYIYLKLESDRNLSKAQFFIDSDAKKISGMYTGSYGGSGFDYVLENDGFYELVHRGDFSSKLVQSMNYNIDSDVLEVAIDKSKFDYLAKDFGVMVFFLGSSEYNLPKSGSIKKFTDINFNANQVDKVPPVITVAKPSMVASESNYTKPNFATAYDVFDANIITVSVDDSKVDKTKNGYYSVIYTATDNANNISKKSTIVQIVGATSSSKLELKKLGEMDDDIVVDHQSGLVWSNDNTLIKENEVSTRGCYFMGGGISDSDAKSALNNFCEQSNYAGFTKGWRVPTPLELSKFTFRMQQEGNEPGMGKHGCVNVIAIDENNNTKAVWTRKYKVDEKDKIFAGFIDDGFNFPAGGRCVRGEIDGDNGGFEVELNATFTSAKVLKDTKKKLMWVNEFNPANNACLAIHFNIPEELNASKDFCQKLNYSGYTNWRTPTSVELSNFVIKTNEAHIFTGYEATCKRLLAKDDDNISKVVYTRFDTNATHALGGVANLEANLTSNIGLRCVRDN